MYCTDTVFTTLGDISILPVLRIPGDTWCCDAGKEF